MPLAGPPDSSSLHALCSMKKELPVAILADSRMQGLTDILDQILPYLPSKASLWLSGENVDGLHWAISRDIDTIMLDDEETIALVVPTLHFPVEVTRRTLDPVQLVFVGRNEVSEDGYLMGGVYSMLNLIPRRFHYKISRYLSGVLLELYMRFKHFPAIIPSHRENPSFLCGDAWALDEYLLNQVPPRFGALHVALRNHLQPPESFSHIRDMKVGTKTTEDRLFQRFERLSSFFQCLPNSMVALYQAALILYQVTSLRLKRIWQI
jgi:hypothetical protein